jgi:DNA polymerase III gamma/tau subunit
VAFAQGGGQGRGQRQPGMGMRGGMNMTLAGMSSMYLSRTDVQEDLKITDEQKTKIKAVQDKQREEMGKLFQGGFNRNASEDEQKAAREKMQKDMQKLTETSQKEINAILTETQQKRLKEVSIQISKNNALMFSDIQKELKITEKQKTDMNALQTKMNDANRSVMEKMRNQEITQEDAMKLFQKNQEALSTEYGKVLTEEQAKKFKEMQGAPFKADKKYENRGMMGGPGMGGPGMGGRGMSGRGGAGN